MWNEQNPVCWLDNDVTYQRVLTTLAANPFKMDNAFPGSLEGVVDGLHVVVVVEDRGDVRLTLLIQVGLKKIA